MWVTSGFRTFTVTVVSPFPMVCDPLVTTRDSEGLGDGFVERRGGHVERVCSLVQIMDNYCAGFERH